MAKITVQNTEITVTNVNGEDYICITDMLKAKDGDFFVTDWLRNRNTMEFLGVWERIYNPNFNYGEFATDKFLCTVEYDYPKFHLTMHCYLCSLVGALINHIKPFL